MIKNILLLFLSDVKTKSIDNKIVISEAHYENVEGENTQTTNESAVRYLLKEFPLDQIFIFASKKVRAEIAGYVGEDNKPRTHLEFSLERFKKFLPTVNYFVFDYDENNSGNENLQSVAEMARHIQEFAANDKVTLHVDLSGGMRHVNMLMLELTRLLEYSGLTVGKVLYSNYNAKDRTGRIEELQNVYDLFQLIAGVEEFVNFGSVHALEKYYEGRKISPPLEKLRNAMKNFAESIKLCYYGQFKETIENLHDAVSDFNKVKSNDVEDILMSRLIGRIQNSYHELIAIREKDDIRVIRWCLNNDYLQQALTLYTERIPEYLGEKGFIMQSEEEINKLTVLVNKDEMGRNRFYYLLNVCTPRRDPTEEAFKELCAAVKRETIGKKNIDVDAWIDSLNSRLSPFNTSISDEVRLRSQVETFNKIRQNPMLLTNLTSSELDPIRKIIDKLSNELAAEEKVYMRKKIIFDFVNHLSNKDFAKFFPGVVFAKNILDKFPRAYKVYKLLADEIFSVKNTETFLNIMEKYFLIQNERNHSNHARADFGKLATAKGVKDFMNDALKEIEDKLDSMIFKVGI